MKTISFLAMLVALVLAGSAVYMYFTYHFALTTMLAITGVGLFFFAFAIMVTLRHSSRVE